MTLATPICILDPLAWKIISHSFTLSQCFFMSVRSFLLGVSNQLLLFNSTQCSMSCDWRVESINIQCQKWIFGINYYHLLFCNILLFSIHLWLVCSSGENYFSPFFHGYTNTLYSISSSTFGIDLEVIIFCNFCLLWMVFYFTFIYEC
jgi:hypothetical protein